MAVNNSLKTLNHTDKEISSLIQNLDKLDLDSSYYLVLLVGENKKAKKAFINQLKKSAGSSFAAADLVDYITSNERESYQATDKLIEDIGSKKIVWLRNGDQLGGVYTGYSYSETRYATPQERYLLKKMTGSEKIFFLDLDDKHTVNNTLKRHAQTLIKFELPGSFLGRLKQITVHGHSFPSKRKPVA